MDAPDFAGELLLELRGFLVFSFRGRAGGLVAQEKLLFGGLRFGRRLDFGDGALLRGGELAGGRLLLQPLHGEFVGGFHGRWACGFKPIEG